MIDSKINSLLEHEDPAVRELANEVLRLRKAIQEHRDKTGHELCWLNDVELWKAVGATSVYPHKTIPVREEFLGQCARFYESRLKGTHYAEPTPKKTI